MNYQMPFSRHLRDKEAKTTSFEFVRLIGGIELNHVVYRRTDRMDWRTHIRNDARFGY